MSMAETYFWTNLCNWPLAYVDHCFRNGRWST